MRPENETGVLALLLVLAAALYMLTWSIAGPIADPDAPAATSPDRILPAGITSQLAGPITGPR